MELANLLLESFAESPRDGGSLGFIEGHLGVFEDSLRVRQGFIAVVVISWRFWAKMVCLYFKHDGM